MDGACHTHHCLQWKLCCRLGAFNSLLIGLAGISLCGPKTRLHLTHTLALFFRYLCHPPRTIYQSSIRTEYNYSYISPLLPVFHSHIGSSLRLWKGAPLASLGTEHGDHRDCVESSAVLSARVEGGAGHSERYHQTRTLDRWQGHRRVCR